MLGQETSKNAVANTPPWPANTRTAAVERSKEEFNI